jgi:hypothetical protein
LAMLETRPLPQAVLTDRQSRLFHDPRVAAID